MAYIIHPDGSRTNMPARKKFTLEDLQRGVGGCIEAVPGTNHRVWCNEEGLLKNLPYNATASLQYNVRLVGSVVVLEKGDHQ